MKNLHLFPNEKFTEPYIEFINRNFNSADHFFLVVGKGVGARINTRKNVKEISIRFMFLGLLIKELNNSKKIFLHGLFNGKLILILFFQPWLLKKCNWIIWGGDLYRERIEKKTLKLKIIKFIRKRVIKKMGGFITHIKGDYELAKKWYDTEGKYHYSFLYPSNQYKEYDLSKIDKSTKKIYVQVGNSADPSNNHIEIFEKLSKIDENFEVICPLSYGDVKYAEKIINKGYELLGGKFNPIIEFIPYNEYIDQLAKIDIAIFNHKRQQALGNITTLLSLGKKIYIRDDITTWQFCRDHGFKIYSINKELDSIFDLMPNEQVQNNCKIMKEKFSEEKLIKDWNKIFSS